MPHNVNEEPKIRFRIGVTRDERGIESQTQEGIDDDRRAEKWEAEGDEE